MCPNEVVAKVAAVPGIAGRMCSKQPDVRYFIWGTKVCVK
jgi:hypothetical protein